MTNTIPQRKMEAVSGAPAVGAIVMLLLAVIGSWPYGFYQLLRLVVCGSAAYMAFKGFERNSQGWAWVMVGVALLFNPLIPVRFAREDWQTLDLIAAGVFGAVLWSMKRQTRA